MTWLLPSVLPLVRWGVSIFYYTVQLIFFAEDEMDVSALNLGMIAAYYNISCKYPRSATP
jgi:hypothetical protein